MRTSAVIKSALRGSIPFSAAIRQTKRRIISYEDNIDNSYYCIEHSVRQILALRRNGATVEGAKVLEFGSGWLPLVSLVFAVAGAREIVLTDIEHLMDEGTISLAKQRVFEKADYICDNLDVSRARLEAALRSFTGIYRVPWRASRHPADDIDILVSRAVLEHVPRDDLEILFPEFLRILVPRGMCCHVIDNSDHWEHRDKTISRVNFLRYEESDLLWRLAQMNVQTYQNRLRHSDYIGMLERSGFAIADDIREPDSAALATLATFEVASPFRDKNPADLCTLESLIVAQKPFIETRAPQSTKCSAPQPT
jgi:hypothetical protein